MKVKLFIISCVSFLSFSLYALPNCVDLPYQEEFEQYWQLVSESQEDEGELIQEWVPKGESEQLWTKSFGIQRYQLEKDYDLRHFYNMVIETLSKDLGQEKASLKHELLLEKSNHLIFCWSSDENCYEVKREWVHLLKNKNNEFVFVRFGTQTSDLNDEDNVWRECIEKAELLEA